MLDEHIVEALLALVVLFAGTKGVLYGRHLRNARLARTCDPTPSPSTELAERSII